MSERTKYRIEMTVKIWDDQTYRTFAELETSLFIPEKSLLIINGEHLANMARILEPSFCEAASEQVAALCAERLKVEQPVEAKEPAF